MKVQESDVVLEGEDKILDHPEYANIDKIKNFLSVVTSKDKVMSLLSDDGKDIKINVKIGSEDYDEIPKDFEGRWVWKDDLAYFARGFKESLESKKPEACNGGKKDDKKDGKAAESKKSEGIGDHIKMNIDYNTFMRLLDAAAYLEADDDYKDALWDYYSEFGEIDGDADVFFDNLFQYTDWKDVDDTYDELDDSFKDESKSKEECIRAALEEASEINGSTVSQYGDHYLWIY
jgi:hypothetical protein